MQPTDILMEEHRVIELVLNCLEKMAEQCEIDNNLDVDSAEKAIAFFRVFADECHHGKEEDLLFPELESKGFSAQQGPTGVMRHEHEEGRSHVAAMSLAIEAFSNNPKHGCRIFARHAREFVSLLREHIKKEDHCLFPMANQALSVSDQQRLMHSFEDVEHNSLGHGTHEKYLAIANQLANRFGVSKVTTVPTSKCCGGFTLHAASENS